MANPNCFSVIWAGRRAYQTLLSPCDFSVLVNAPHGNRSQPCFLTSRLLALSSRSYSSVMDLLWALFVSMFAICVAIPMDAAAGSHSLFSCEPITLRMCQGLPYNSTFMPNMFKHYDQQTAALAMEVWYADMSCSKTHNKPFSLTEIMQRPPDNFIDVYSFKLHHKNIFEKYLWAGI